MSPRTVAQSHQQLRQVVAAARLYHVHGARQREIGERLGVSQTKVSRLLRQAEESGLVQTVVRVPEGLHCELEDTIERIYGVLQVHVIDTPEGSGDLAPLLGGAAARLLAESCLSGDVLGFTSWSRTLQELARALEASARAAGLYVVEMLGDLGSPQLQHAAARATQSFADAVGAQPVFLRTPGVVATPQLHAAALANPHVGRALSMLDAVDVALVGVGPPAVHGIQTTGDNYFAPEQLEQARVAGAVGQLNQRFIDADGRAVVTPLDDLVVGSTLAQLARAKCRVVVAGGPDKQVPVRAALIGGWVDVLVTDVFTARSLIT